MRICLLVGSADISGGTFVLFQHALHLEAAGHEVTIAVMFPVEDVAPDWHPALSRLTFCRTEEVTGRFDLALASWWKSVYELPNVDAAQYGYFVQSIESRFYPEAEQPLRRLVDATYDLPLPVITEATWIRDQLQQSTGRDVQLVRNGVLKDVYCPDGPADQLRQPGSLRVLVEGPLGVPFKNVPRTLRLCGRADVGPVWLLTITDIDSYPGVERVVSRVPVARTAEVYRSCDVLVKLSHVEGMFGPPLEMFHCGGTAITYDVSGHDEYLVDGVNSLVVRSGDEDGVVRALQRLRDEPELLDALKEGARRTAEAWPSWEQSSREFAGAVERLCALPTVDREALRAATTRDWDQYVDDEQRRLTRTPRDRLRAVVKPWLRTKHPRVFRALANTHYRYTSGVRGSGDVR